MKNEREKYQTANSTFQRAVVKYDRKRITTTRNL